MTTALLPKDDEILSFIDERELLETTLQNMMEYVPAAHIYWKDKEGKYLGCNKTQAKSLGFTTSLGLIGKTDFELPWPDGYALEFRENDLDVIRTGKIKVIEENATMNGKNVVVLSQKIPLRNKQCEIIGVLGISLDITNRKTKALE